MPRVSRAVATIVRERAGHLCEYCGRPEATSRLRFVCDHVIAVQHLGPTSPENLALCCAFCNLHKGPNVAGVDPDSGDVIPLFNPRRQLWREHFRWDGAAIVGISPAGRATIIALGMNDREQLVLRTALFADGKMRAE
jgi:HNH endonuclease